MSRTIASKYSEEGEDHTTRGGPPLHDGWEGCFILALFVAVFAFAFTHCSRPPHPTQPNPPCLTK